MGWSRRYTALNFNEGGASLVQVLLFSSAIAGMAVLGIQMAKDQEVLAHKLTQQFEIKYLVAEMKYLLSHPASCLATVKGADPILDKGSIKNLVMETNDPETGNSLRHLRYEVYNKNQLVYGNNDIRIKSYVLEGNKNGADVKKGLVNFNIVFQRILDDGKVVNVNKKIPLTVKLDEKGGISFCQTYSKIKKSIPGFKVSSSGMLIAEKEKMIIGNSDQSATLNLENGLQLEDGSGVCSSSSKGHVRFNAGMDLFEFCNGRDWEPLGQSSLRWENKKTYKAIAAKASQGLQISEKHRLCILTEMKSEGDSGKCHVKPQEGNAMKKWELRAESRNPFEKTECMYTCFN